MIDLIQNGYVVQKITYTLEMRAARIRKKSLYIIENTKKKKTHQNVTQTAIGIIKSLGRNVSYQST
jgi:hypothetical protein